MFQMERAQICTLLTNNKKGFNKSTNNNIQTFQHVSLPKGLNLAKKQDLDKKWDFFFMRQTSLSMLCNTQRS
jgi:hypothetical protein